ncbi:MAG: hypothetical protein ACO1QR_08910, partial [Chthoniobacteraceae bacterium]
HGFAACLSGTFHRKDQEIPKETKAVLLLLRHDLKAARAALTELRAAGKTVVVTFKEAGAFQVAEVLAKPDRLRLFREICARAAGAISTTPDLVPIYRAAGAREVEFIPTPYPVEDERWDFSTPAEQRKGIFIGTREWSVPSRNHLAALLTLRPLAEAMQEPVTVFNVDGWRGRRMLDALQYPEHLLKVIEGRLPYPKYLRLMAQHRFVFQLDASAVPGQVAGDALLCRIPCVGGNGTTERLAFPAYCSHGRTHDQMFDLATRLLEHPADRAQAVEEALDRARMSLSFAAGARDLASLFRRLGVE